jgi:hypothetical protein
MRYIKVSCDMEKSCVSLDWDTTKFFELGWELAITHLQSKRMISTGQIDPKTDTLVVSTDRAFLYENVCKTMHYRDFIKLPKPDNFTDLTASCGDYLNETAKQGVYANKYKFYEEDKHLIHNINYSSIQENSPFFVVHARYRNWIPQRNFPLEFWVHSLRKLLLHFKIKCYVFGENTEALVNNETTFAVGMRDYATLLNNPNCKFFVGSMSGGSMISQLCCHPQCKTFIIENHPRTKGHPLFHDESLNFAGFPTHFNTNRDGLINDVIHRV